VGNYCPYCSQQGGIGPIGWKSVFRSIGEVWGLHNRSLLYSIVQLLLRPGYFISDYIGGKRQVSFPPVKMLVLIGVLGVIVDFLTGAIHGMLYSHGEKMAYVNDAFEWLNTHVKGMFPPPSDYLSGVLQWLNTHPDVFSLILLSFLIVPNYYIFRFAPRNTRHTLPQGFFIQVFSTVLFLSKRTPRESFESTVLPDATEKLVRDDMALKVDVVTVVTEAGIDKVLIDELLNVDEPIDCSVVGSEILVNLAL
jgi:hypothetical protein